MAKARIFKPAKNAMQSGTANVNHWRLEWEPETRKTTDKLIGWNGSTDMKQEVKLKFDTLEEAVKYAESNGIEYEVFEEHKSKFKPKSYAENFTG